MSNLFDVLKKKTDIKKVFAELSDDEAFEVMAYRRTEQTKKALDGAIALGHEADFVESLRDFFNARGYLTDRQIDSIKNRYMPRSRYFGNAYDDREYDYQDQF